jgi:DNA-binding NarL/FixJ family response regulator
MATVPSDGDGRGVSWFRAIVVEDHEPFRRFVRSTLEKRTELRVIAEASDGLEAVQKAKELQPDLIVLDVGLPSLNGIEAARRIRKISPKSKILFLSQESSVDLIEEAFRLGALGYVIKAKAGSELLTAVSAVLRGETFASSRFAGHNLSRASHVKTPESTRCYEIFTPLQPLKAEITRRHEAAFYSDDRRLLEDLTQFIGTALKAGDAVIVIATETHRDSLPPRLQAYGLDIGAAIEQRRYISLDAAQTLSTFMVNGMPDPVRFVKLLGSLIATAAEAAKGEQARVAVFGECVHLLWEQGNAEAAIQMEKLGNQLAEAYDVDILCGYSLSCVQGGMDSDIFHRICAEHSVVRSQ